MDARGLTALLRADRRARALGIGLHLTALPATVTRLLAITGLDRHFTLTAGPAHAT
jgi:anti-anti-sigma regulatory factor